MANILDSERARFDIEIIEARGLKAADHHTFSRDTSDPYAKVFIKHDPASYYKTKVIDRNLNPTWNETCAFFPTREQMSRDSIRVQVYDKDKASKDDLLGELKINLSWFLQEEVNGLDAWYPLCNKKKGTEEESGWSKGKGEIHLKIMYVSPQNAKKKTKPKKIPKKKNEESDEE